MSSPAFTLPTGNFTTGGHHELRDPGAIGDVVGSYPLLDPAVVDAAVTAAAAAQPAWASLDPMRRCELISRAADRVSGPTLGPLLVREQGKTLAEAVPEAGSLRVVTDRYRPQAEWLAEQQAIRGRGVRYRPNGVAAVITPWNWPVRISCALTVPALIAGNAVVLHVSPSAPLTAMAVFGELARALPPGVLTILTHPEPSIAAALVAHPGVRKVAFTGARRWAAR